MQSKSLSLLYLVVPLTNLRTQESFQNMQVYMLNTLLVSAEERRTRARPEDLPKVQRGYETFVAKSQVLGAIICRDRRGVSILLTCAVAIFNP